MDTVALVEWGPERASALAALVADALPDEGIEQDELLACCWDDPGQVLGTVDGQAAVSVVVRGQGDDRVGFVKLLVVAPGARRAGLGAQLLAEGEAWARGQGATTMRLGDAAPFYLWPGVDVARTAMLCLAERAGYRVAGAELDLRCPTTFRAKPPSGVEVRRVLDEVDVAAVLAYARDDWPWWVAELERGVEQGGAFAAVASVPVAEGAEDIEDGAPPTDAPAEVVGFACHSVNRAAWIGPMATRPDQQGRGVGSALLSALCRDLMVAGHRDAEIAWIGPMGFYARVAGATVSRVCRTFIKPLD